MQLDSGSDHSCAVTRAGQVYCWGRNDSGQIGDGSRDRHERAIQVPRVRATHVSAGFGSTCWGDGTHGQLGPSEGGYADEPVRVEGLPPALGLTAWETRVCATDVEGHVWCWGSDEPFDRDTANPTMRAYLGPAEQAAIGSTAACARLAEGGLCCWGSNLDGLLGDMNRPFSNPPFLSEIPVPMSW